MLPRHLSIFILVVSCAVAMTGLAAATQAAEAPRKISLLVADWNYNPNDDSHDDDAFYPDLPRTCEDNKFALGIDQVKASLDAHGFEIEPYCNLNRADLSAAVAGFAARTKTLPAGSIVFIYYAGHGIQAYGNAFVVPVKASKPLMDAAYDAKTPAEQIAVANSVANDIQAMLLTLTDRRDVAIVVALDNCRNNPFEHSDAAAISGSNEHVNIDTRKNVLIQYRTAPTKTSVATNRYATILAEEISRGGEISEIMRKADERLATLYESEEVEEWPTLNGAALFNGTSRFFLEPPNQPVKVAAPQSKGRVRYHERETLTPPPATVSAKRTNLRILWCEGDGELERRAFAQSFAEFVRDNADSLEVGSITIVPLSHIKNFFEGYGGVNRNLMRYDNRSEAALLTRIARAYPQGGFLPQQGQGMGGDATPSVSAFVCGPAPRVQANPLQRYLVPDA